MRNCPRLCPLTRVLTVSGQLNVCSYSREERIMNHELGTPSQLHRQLERAKDTPPDERKRIITLILDSGNFAVIRRIPDLLLPLTESEQSALLTWAERAVEAREVSRRDFIFHLMLSCGTALERILELLQRHRTFSRKVLEDIQQMVAGGSSEAVFRQYQADVAETLLKGDDVRTRDHGCHLLMTIARGADWAGLAERFSVAAVDDLRQHVYERFLDECPDVATTTTFVDNVIAYCWAQIEVSGSGHDVSRYLHWIITGHEKLGRKDDLAEAAREFRRRFPESLPNSLLLRLKDYLPQQVRRLR